MEVRSTRTIDVPGMNCDDDDDKEEKFEDIDQLSPLEEFGQDVMNTMLSFLYLDEFQTLSTVSKRMNDAVTYTSHIHMSDAAIPQSQHVQQQQQQHRRSEAHLTEDGLRKLLRRFRSLNVLTLYGLAPVGDHLFSILNESPTAHTLHRLSLHGCCLSYWCPTTLQLQNLTHVTVTGGSIRVAFGSFFASSSDHLQSLSIGQCSSLRDENVTDMVVGLQDQLQQLTLHQCLRVKKPTLRFSRLTQLNLLGCFSLSDLPDFDCPSLTLLVLSFCFQLDGSVIQRVVNRLPQLEHLGLVKCPGLIRLELTHNPLLQRLNVSLSNNLQYLQLHCPKLVQLETASCSSLQGLELSSNDMVELSLSMLPLRRLELNLPALRQLKLCGCSLLRQEACKIRCPAMDFLDTCGTLHVTPAAFGKIRVVRHGGNSETTIPVNRFNPSATVHDTDHRPMLP